MSINERLEADRQHREEIARTDLDIVLKLTISEIASDLTLSEADAEAYFKKSLVQGLAREEIKNMINFLIEEGE